jgi:hypothetical protein
MRFKKSNVGYLKLGFIFTIFSSVVSTLMLLVILPVLLGGVIFGGIPGLLISGPAVVLIMIFVNGWFIFWFYSENKFVK